MDKRDAENILRITDNYAIDDIRKASKSLLKKYHPDICKKNGIDAEFGSEYTKTINEAADFLSKYTATRSSSPIHTSVPWENHELYKNAEFKLSCASTHEEFIAAAILFERSKYRDYENRRQECIAYAKGNQTAVDYLKAVKAMNAANTEGAYRKVAKMLERVSGYRDADTLRASCLEKADQLKAQTLEAKRMRAEEEKRRKAAEKERQRKIYDKAVKGATNKSLESLQEAVRLFSSIPGYSDSDLLCEKCKLEIERIQREEKYLYALKRFKEAKTVEDYKTASKFFKELGNYKDSPVYLQKAQRRIKFTETFSARTYGAALRKIAAIPLSAFLVALIAVVYFAYFQNTKTTLQIQLLNTSDITIETISCLDLDIGTTYNISAPELKGYEHSGKDSKAKNITISKTESKNVLHFTYLKKTSYTVSYVEKKTGKHVAKTVTKKSVESKKLTLKAKKIKGYTLVSTKTKKLKVTRSKDKNKVTFYYKKEAKNPSSSTNTHSSYSSSSSQSSSSYSSNNSPSSGGSTSSSSNSSSSSSTTKNPFSTGGKSKGSSKNPFSK